MADPIAERRARLASERRDRRVALLRAFPPADAPESRRAPSGWPRAAAPPPQPQWPGVAVSAAALVAGLGGVPAGAIGGRALAVTVVAGPPRGRAPVRSLAMVAASGPRRSAAAARALGLVVAVVPS